MKTADPKELRSRPYLRHLNPCQMVYTITTRHGATRSVRLLIPAEGVIMDITRPVARACGMQLNIDQTGIVVSGSGFSAAGHVLEALNHALWPDATAEEQLKNISL